MKDKKTNQELYSGLIRHRGAIAELAKRCSKHRNTITLVLRGGKGEFSNELIVEEAAKLLHELEIVSSKRRAVVITLLNESKQLARVDL